MRKTGIRIIGDVAWGTHFCQFYQTEKDLIDILVPYFKAGLKNNEFCMWITSEPLTVDEVKKAMKKAMPDFQKYLKKRQIEIIPHSEWYLKGGGFNADRVLKGWVDKLNLALGKGYDGLRLTGNTFWLEKKDWKQFTDYEEKVNNVIGKYKMIAICTYSLNKCGAFEVIDVVCSHQFALIKRAGKWEIIQSYEEKKAEDELRKLNRILKALSESDQAMMRARNESDYLKEVCNIVAEDCGYSMVWIGFAENDENKTVRPVAQAGFEKGYLKTVNITWQDTERGRGPTGTAIRTGKPAICRNMLTDPNFRPWRKEAIKRGYASSIVLPLIANGKAFGAINIYSKIPDPFSEEEVKLLVELADDLAYGIMSIRLRLEHQQAEEALRQTRDYLDNLFNYANAPIICWDVKFKITRFNHAFEHLTNYQAKEVIGKDLSILFPKDSNKESLNKIKRTLKGEHWEVVEIPILRKDGGIRTVLWNSASVYAEDGKTLLATIAQGQDITVRKKMAEALKKANDELELKISQRTEELMRVQNELNEKKRLSDIGTLAATVAHELRNPLAAVRMAAYNIKTKAQNPLLDKHLENIEIKIKESEQIISNLLFYSKIKMPHYGNINIHNILNACIKEAASQFSKYSIEVKKRIEPIKELLIEADPIQAKEVFSNILNNAFDALEEHKGRIEIEALCNNETAKVLIKDSGVGIAKEDSEKVFEPFFTTKAKGTGLGLAVCQQIVHLHHGSIHIESERGKGTAVAVILPIKQKKNA